MEERRLENYMAIAIGSLLRFDPLHFNRAIATKKNRIGKRYTKPLPHLSNFSL